MPLFLELHSNALLEGRAVLLQLGRVLLERLPQFVLPVQADGAEPDTRLRTEHAINCALPSWHNGRRIRIFRPGARKSPMKVGARVRDRVWAWGLKEELNICSLELSAGSISQGARANFKHLS